MSRFAGGPTRWVLVLSTVAAAASSGGYAPTAQHATFRSTSASPGWVIQVPPNPVGSTGATLTAVACPGKACIAVGQYYSGGVTTTPFAEQGIRSGWSLQTMPSPTGAVSVHLTAVACTTADGCTAVGYYSDTSGVDHPMAERWDGVAWSVQEVPVPAGALGGSLGGVACTGPSTCVAVGQYSASPLGYALVERWDGATWSSQEAPDPGMNNLVDVSCATPSRCVAVGSTWTGGGFAGLAERWDGTTWSVMSTPDPAGSAIAKLLGVSCGRVVCNAVGWYVDGITQVTLAERWNGRTWFVVPSPNPAGGSNFLLSHIACSSGGCNAVGSYRTGTLIDATLSEHLRHRSWTIQDMPDPPGDQGARLSGIACAFGVCTAVGSYTSAYIDRTLVERHPD